MVTKNVSLGELDPDNQTNNFGRSLLEKVRQ